MKNGAERTIDEARDHMRVLRPLQEFNYYEGQVDKGSGVREKSKQLIDLIQNNEMIREEREKARKLKNKFVGISNDGPSGGGGYGGYSGGGGGSYGGSGSDSYGGNRGGSSYDNDHRRSNYSNNDSDTRGGSSYDSDTRKGNTGRYGRDYDNERPSKFSDDATSASSTSYDRDVDDDSRFSKPKKSTSTVAAKESTGKIKMSIKNDASGSSSRAKANTSTAPAAPAIDFFDSAPSNTNTDFFSAPAASNTATFDAFGKTTI